MDTDVAVADAWSEEDPADLATQFVTRAMTL